MGIVTPDGVTVKTPTPIETLPFSAISLELPSIIAFIDARNLLGLPSGIGPVGTPISCKFCTVFKNDLVGENPSKDFAANNKGNGISPPAFAIEFNLLVIPIFKSCKSSSNTLLHSLKSLVILIKDGKIETIESLTNQNIQLKKLADSLAPLISKENAELKRISDVNKAVQEALQKNDMTALQATIEKEAAFETYSDKNKLLTLHFTLFELLNAGNQTKMIRVKAQV